ncbi:BTAD domain-containing putative transcriptional regulator [Nonomuraea sp. NPDC050310]|uniref:AfsR/SARP family transcriptional regulator n=1 Tax=Nonomuraea sp. NPDC050310 TaxID=3154935 RepID=UPI0033F14DEC
MEFRLLGPIEVWDGTQQVPLGGPKPRALLAALLLEAGHVVSVDRLVDLVWGERAPGTARGQVQTYVSALRQALGSAGELIETRPPGYRVRLDGASLDLHAFERLVADGRQAAEHGRHQEAAQAFRAAEELWRGPALGGIGEVLYVDAARLAELRLTVVEERIAAELASGRQSEVVAELTSLVASHPTREGLRGQLMTALYRLGRSTEALASYDEGRAFLAEELGIDPGPRLRMLHQAVLSDDTTLLGSSPARPRNPDAVVPAQLPADVPAFVGRSDFVTQTAPLLTPGHTAPPILVISGKGGVGKSAAAVHLAHGARDHFPDGQLYADLRGITSTPATAAEVLSRFLRALGVPYAAQPESPEDLSDLYRSLLARRRLLVILDDARDEQQIRPLLPGGAGCAVLITSRGRLAGLSGAHLASLDVLDTEGALALLGSVVGEGRIAEEPQAALEIVRLCGSLPLAVRTAGARLVTRRHWTMSVMAARLADEHRRLDELAVGDVAVRASVGLSYQALDGQAQAAFRRLGLLGVPDFASWILAPLLGVSVDDAEEVLERLLDAQLVDGSTVDATGQMRYRLHDLLRVFAAERAGEDDPAAEREAAVTRVLGSWLWLITTASSQAPSGEPVLDGPHLSIEPVETRTAKDLLTDPTAWLEAETPALIVAVERAAGMNLDVAACELATALSFSHIFVANRLADWRASHDAALHAARRSGNRVGEAALLAALSQIHYSMDRYDAARERLQEALAIFSEAGDVRGEAVVLAGLGYACREQCRLREGLDYLSRSVELFQELGDDLGIGAAARAAAAIYLELGDYDAIWPHLDRAMEAYRRSGSLRGQALTLRTRSTAHRALEEYAQAGALSTQALALLRELDDTLMVAYAVQSLAKTEIRQGRGAAVLPSLLEAYEVCQANLDPFGEALMLRTIGELHLAAGQLDLAEAHLVQAIAVSEEISTPVPAARAKRDLASVLLARGETAAAQAMLAEAKEIFARHEAREFKELS